jgi:hypothetical protein
MGFARNWESQASLADFQSTERAAEPLISQALTEINQSNKSAAATSGDAVAKPVDTPAPAEAFDQPEDTPAPAEAFDQGVQTPAPGLDRATERTRLEALTPGVIKGRDLKRFTEDLNSLERRAQTAGLTDTQLAETYHQVARILSAGNSAILPESERIKIAQQVVRNAARPTSIDQGKHGTCNVNVVESRVYTRNPEAAAKLVADVAITGSFTTADGFTITPTRRSLMPDDESGSNPPADGQRGAASHVFQVTAANIRWQRTVLTPDGQLSAWGKVVYEQIPSKRSRFSGDTGERIMDYNANPPRETTDYKRGPSLSVSDLPGISNQITGRSEKDFVIENKVHGGSNTTLVTSPRELEDALTKGSVNMPMFIRVHTGNDPFLTESGGNWTRQRGVWHVVSITGYDAKTQKVTIDNQWGSRSDRTIALDKLYKSTMEPGTTEWKKKHEFFIVPGTKVIDPLRFDGTLEPPRF